MSHSNSVLNEALRKIRNGDRCVSVGICRNVEADTDLLALMRKWPLAEGETSFPVGGAVEYRNERIAGTLWDNPRRLQLLDWLIEQTDPVSLKDRILAELKCNGGNVYRAAKTLGCSYKYAQPIAKQAGYNGTPGRKPKLDWSAVDWSLDTLTLAAQLGVHRSTVDARRRAVNHGG